jgi:hypothetical protein
MTYEPKINDYVKWKPHIKGWVYFKCKEYITIEVAVRPKNQENYKACSLHQNERVLVLCYNQQWKELKYIRSRKTIIDTSFDTSDRPNHSTMESKASSD